MCGLAHRTLDCVRWSPIDSSFINNIHLAVWFFEVCSTKSIPKQKSLLNQPAGVHGSMLLGHIIIHIPIIDRAPLALASNQNVRCTQTNMVCCACSLFCSIKIGELDILELMVWAFESATLVRASTSIHSPLHILLFIVFACSINLGRIVRIVYNLVMAYGSPFAAFVAFSSTAANHQHRKMFGRSSTSTIHTALQLKTNSSLFVQTIQFVWFFIHSKISAERDVTLKSSSNTP